jgi:predicted enzyme related to lactoylglutathione lyase
MNSMLSPLDNKIGSVFVPVSDMARAIAWYSRLFGLPVETTTHAGRIYNVPMAGEAGLILDGHRPVASSSQPLCFFWTGDIQAAEAFLRENGVEIMRGGVQDIGGLFTLTFTDPDGNLLMACQRKG